MTNREPIRIGIDGRALVQPHTGIARYIIELCKVLDRLLPDAAFFVYTKRPVCSPVGSPRWFVRCDGLVGAKHLHDLPWLMLRGRALIERDRLDVFWGAMTILPRLPESVRAVVTVYDLFHLDRKLVSLKRWLSYALLYERSLARANAIAAISETTAHRLYGNLGYNSAAIVRPGISELYRPHHPKEVEACLQLYGIRTPYIFAVVSSFQPRKNLGALIGAFCALKADGMLAEYCLILAGGGSEAAVKSEFAQAAESGAISSLGGVPEDHLALLYCGAKAFVFPSTHEGFGIPVLEARACGCKVVATDIPELREAGGNDAIYVTPSLQAIRAGIIRALAETGKGRPSKPLLRTWDSSGRVLARLLVSACGELQ